MNTINTARAAQIAASWHGGQWSALYQFASSQTYLVENCLRYLQEVEECLHPEYKLYPGELTQKDERELNSLKNWFIRQAKEFSLQIEYKKHHSYGYLIPFVANEHNPIEITELYYPI